MGLGISSAPNDDVVTSASGGELDNENTADLRFGKPPSSRGRELMH